MRYTRERFPFFISLFLHPRVLRDTSPSPLGLRSCCGGWSKPVGEALVLASCVATSYAREPPPPFLKIGNFGGTAEQSRHADKSGSRSKRETFVALSFRLVLRGVCFTVTWKMKSLCTGGASPTVKLNSVLWNQLFQFLTNAMQKGEKRDNP